jgi:hypothetical protein
MGNDRGLFFFLAINTNGQKKSIDVREMEREECRISCEFLAGGKRSRLFFFALFAPDSFMNFFAQNKNCFPEAGGAGVDPHVTVQPLQDPYPDN